MSRPEISVVMPFAGDRAAAQTAVATLLTLDTLPGDELILADNSGVVSPAPRITVVRAAAERSPAHARNAGAERARNEWILFLDADCRARGNLLDAYFSRPVAGDVGALAGEVIPAPAGDTLAERYGAARSFLSQQAHLAHPFKPRAVAANLLVRRAAFEQVGGFYEGMRAAEDTDFSWRIQGAGWRLELCRAACVEHHYRTSLRELRRQWRGYAAGRAWLARRYGGFDPESALRRALRRVSLGRGPRTQRVGGQPAPRRQALTASAGRLERSGYLAIDALLSVEEIAGFALSNRPARDNRLAAEVVLVADRFPARGDPLVDLARTLDGARVEAVARPESPTAQLSRTLAVDYREDDGAAARVQALVALALRHPIRCGRDRLRRAPKQPKLLALAPAVRRVERDAATRILPLGGAETRATAQRLATLAGRPLSDTSARTRRRRGPFHRRSRC